MSTHCGIAVKTEKGYETIYCHNDGYPEYMIPMLTQNYNSKELAMELIDYGDASYIDEKLRPTELTHHFDTPQPGVCIFYHRDRGDKWAETAPEIYHKDSLLKDFWYVYIFENDCWTGYQGGKLI